MDLSHLPGRPRQAGFVVRDIEAAIAGWVALGVGPFFLLRGVPQHADYRGTPCSVTTSIAFSAIGDLQVELIQPEQDTPSIYTEFLDSGREGFQQLAWWTRDFDADLAAAAASGWPVVWSGGEATKYAYLEPPGGPVAVVELSELTEGTEGLDRMVRAAAADWDGSDPVRSL